MEEVAAGMIDAQAVASSSEAAASREGEAYYASEGSLARDMEKQKAEGGQEEAGEPTTAVGELK